MLLYNVVEMTRAPAFTPPACGLTDLFLRSESEREFHTLIPYDLNVKTNASVIFKIVAMKRLPNFNSIKRVFTFKPREKGFAIIYCVLHIIFSQ